MVLEKTETNETNIKVENQLDKSKWEYFDNNPEIKSIYDNTIKKYPNIDSESFEQIMKNISDKVSKENIIKYLPNILDSLLKNDKYFLNWESNTISIIIIKELNGYIKIEKDKVNKSAKEEKSKAKEEKNKTNEGRKLNIENQKKILSDLSQSIPETFKPDLKSEEFKDEIKNLNIWYI